MSRQHRGRHLTWLHQVRAPGQTPCSPPRRNRMGDPGVRRRPDHDSHTRVLHESTRYWWKSSDHHRSAWRRGGGRGTRVWDRARDQGHRATKARLDQMDLMGALVQTPIAAAIAVESAARTSRRRCTRTPWPSNAWNWRARSRSPGNRSGCDAQTKRQEGEKRRRWQQHGEAKAIYIARTMATSHA